MTMQLPPLWATNDNYSTGPDVGTPTKVDPSSSLNGFIKGVIAAPQHVNYVLSKQISVGRRAFLLAALQLRQHTQDGVSISDTAESMAAVQRIAGSPLLALKTAQALALSGCDRFAEIGAPASITSLVVDAATNGTRILVTGSGGNHCTYSDDDGASWSAGNDHTVAAQRLIWFAAISKFLVCTATSVRRSADGSSAWTNASAGIEGAGGLAAGLNGGSPKVFALADAGTTPAFRSSADANTWADTAGTVANDSTFDDKGTIIGNEGALIYHCGRRASGSLMQISASVDGSLWSTLAVLNAPTTLGFASRPRVMMCQNTGLLVIVAPLTTSLAGPNADALYASMDGADWVGPSYVFPGPGINAYAVAGGRVMSTRNDLVFASDGVGF